MQLQATLKRRANKHTPLHTFLIEPFDLGMHATDAGVATLHMRFTAWLRSLTGPARFVCWLMPTTLNDKIGMLSRSARDLEGISPCRSELLMEYRRHFEMLQASADYQRSICGMALWSEENPRALANGMTNAFEAYTAEAAWPALFQGRYRVKNTPFGHYVPIGRPGGRLLWAILSSYDFLPAEWNFFKPTKSLLSVNFPVALSIDIPYTYDRIEGIEAVESTIAAYNVHLAGLRGGEDSRAVQRVVDCKRALQEMNAGDVLHKVQITIAIAAPDLTTLRERLSIITNKTRSHFLLRQESGDLLKRAVGYFAGHRTQKIGIPDTAWSVTSREMALMLAPLGYRKLSNTDGIMRGEAVEGGYPLFHNSWKDKRATHEIWVGISGHGKTFMNNVYLLREYAENGIPFDLLEPMGHGQHLAQAVGVDVYSLSARRTRLNPQDIVYPTSLIEQINHTIRIYETVLGRPLSGGQTQNIERGLLSEALDMLYRGFSDLNAVSSDQVPICQDVCDVLEGLGETDRQKTLAYELSQEIRGLCCGRGTWASFLNGHTNIELSRGGRSWIGPRVFSFHELSDDETLTALAYTQVLSAIRRDSLSDENPRIIAVDEVYRLNRFPALIEFLVEAAKTFRTRRKKLICIDQNMMFFLQKEARYIFENSPIRVIFNQGPGIKVFYEDGAFDHLNKQHKDTIAGLQRFHYVLDIQGEGIWYVYNHPSAGELKRFNMT
ncbi:MAG: hypothetical protein ABI947_04585 [Chloroflexota bacterium]